MLETIQKLQDSRGNTGGDGVTQMEFLVSMLVESGVVPEADVGVLRSVFARAEVDENGMLSQAGLHGAVTSMQVHSLSAMTRGS